MNDRDIAEPSFEADADYPIFMRLQSSLVLLERAGRSFAYCDFFSPSIIFYLFSKSAKFWLGSLHWIVVPDKFCQKFACNER